MDTSGRLSQTIFDCLILATSLSKFAGDNQILCAAHTLRSPAPRAIVRFGWPSIPDNTPVVRRLNVETRFLKTPSLSAGNGVVPPTKKSFSKRLFTTG